jgi:hypothetical protein
MVLYKGKELNFLSQFQPNKTVINLFAAIHALKNLCFTKSKTL